MENPHDLWEVSKAIVDYAKNGDPVKDVIERSAYSETELIYELALFYVANNPR